MKRNIYKIYHGTNFDTSKYLNTLLNYNDACNYCLSYVREKLKRKNYYLTINKSILNNITIIDYGSNSSFFFIKEEAL